MRRLLLLAALGLAAAGLCGAQGVAYTGNPGPAVSFLFQLDTIRQNAPCDDPATPVRLELTGKASDECTPSCSSANITGGGYQTDQYSCVNTQLKDTLPPALYVATQLTFTDESCTALSLGQFITSGQCLTNNGKSARYECAEGLNVRISNCDDTACSVNCTVQSVPSSIECAGGFIQNACVDLRPPAPIVFQPGAPVSAQSITGQLSSFTTPGDVIISAGYCYGEGLESCDEFLELYSGYYYFRLKVTTLIVQGSLHLYPDVILSTRPFTASSPNNYSDFSQGTGIINLIVSNELRLYTNAQIVVDGLGFGGGGGGAGETHPLCDADYYRPGGGTGSTYTFGEFDTYAYVDEGADSNATVYCGVDGGKAGGYGGFTGGDSSISVVSGFGGNGGGFFGGQGGSKPPRNGLCGLDLSSTVLYTGEDYGGNGQPGGYLAPKVNGEDIFSLVETDDVFLGSGGGGGAGAHHSVTCDGLCPGGYGGKGGSDNYQAFLPDCGTGLGGTGGASGGGVVIVDATQVTLDTNAVISANGAGYIYDDETGYGAGGGILIRATFYDADSTAMIRSLGGATYSGVASNGGSVKLRFTNPPINGTAFYEFYQGIVAGQKSICVADACDTEVACDGLVNSTAQVDICGVCGGNGTSCFFGCDGLVNGLRYDVCGVCGGDGQSCVGCDGVPGSGLELDACGVCDGREKNPDNCAPPTPVFELGGPDWVVTEYSNLTITSNACYLDGETSPCSDTIFFYTDEGKNFVYFNFNNLTSLSLTTVNIRGPLVIVTEAFGIEGLRGVLVLNLPYANVIIENQVVFDFSLKGYGGGGGGSGESYTQCNFPPVAGGSESTNSYLGSPPSDYYNQRRAKGGYNYNCGISMAGGNAGGLSGLTGGFSVGGGEPARAFLVGGSGAGPFGGRGGPQPVQNFRCSIDGSPEANGLPGRPGGYLARGRNGEAATMHTNDNVYLGSGGGGGSGARAGGECLGPNCYSFLFATSGCCSAGSGGAGGVSGVASQFSYGTCYTGIGGSGGAAGGGSVAIDALNIYISNDTLIDTSGDGMYEGTPDLVHLHGSGSGGGVLLRAAGDLFMLGKVNAGGTGSDVTAAPNRGTVKLRGTVILPSPEEVAETLAEAAPALSICSSADGNCLGCDGVWSQTPMLYDECGVCGGNGQSCMVCNGHQLPAILWSPQDGMTYESTEAINIDFGVRVPSGCSGSLKYVVDFSRPPRPESGLAASGNVFLINSIGLPPFTFYESSKPRVSPVNQAGVAISISVYSPNNFLVDARTVTIYVTQPEPVLLVDPPQADVNAPATSPFTIDISSSRLLTPQGPLNPISCYFSCQVIANVPESQLPDPCENLPTVETCMFSIPPEVLAPLATLGRTFKVFYTANFPTEDEDYIAGSTTVTPIFLPFTVEIVRTSPGLAAASSNDNVGWIGQDVPLSLSAVTTPAQNRSIMLYEWSCPPTNACPSFSDPSNFLTPVDQRSITIVSSRLTPGATYIFKVKATQTLLEVSTTATIKLYVVGRPTGGSFAAAPQLVTPLNTTTPITLSLTGWSSPTEDLRYRFAYASGLNATLSSPGLLYLGPASSTPSASIPLLSSGNYTVFGLVSAGSLYNATSTVVLTSVVRAVGRVTRDQITNVAQQQLKTALSSGDASAVTSTAGALLDALNQLTGEGENDTGDLRNEIIGEVIDFAGNQTTGDQPLDPDTFSGVLSVLQKGSDSPSELSQNSFDAITDFFEQFAGQVIDPSDAQNFISTFDALLLSQLANPPPLTGDFDPAATNLTDYGLSEDEAARLLAIIRAGLNAFAQTLTCGDDAQTFAGAGLSALVQAPQSAAELVLAIDAALGSISTGAAFSPGGNNEDECATVHFLQSLVNPYANATSNVTIASAVITLEFFDPSNPGTPINVSGLSEDGAITVRLPFDSAAAGIDATNETVLCVYWDPVLGDWNSEGCTKSPETTANELVCVCTHLTEFALGQLVIRINPIVIPPVINLQSRGLIAAWCTIGGLLFLFILLSIYAMWMDARYLARAVQPESKELLEFVEKTHELYQQPVTSRVLQTMHLDVWKDAYGTWWWPNGTKLTIWQRMYMSSRFGFRYNHSYVSIFFDPISMGTRFARVCCTMSSLFVNLAVSAVFFQYTAGNDFFNPDSIALKLAVGFLTSLITFMPFTLIQFLMKHIDRPGLVSSVDVDALDVELEAMKKEELDGDKKKDQSASTAGPVADEASEAEQVALKDGSDAADDTAKTPADKNKKQRRRSKTLSVAAATLLGGLVSSERLLARSALTDFLLPYWVEYILYAVCFLLSAGAIVVTGLYGAAADVIDPTNNLTIAWIQSFFISVAVNVVILQSLQAVIGSIVTAVIGSLATVGTAVALVIGSAAINFGS